MRLVGQALAEYDAGVNCIGIAVWGIVMNREALAETHDLNKTVSPSPSPSP